MKNREKYAQELIQIALTRGELTIRDGKPVSCDPDCPGCDLSRECELGFIEGHAIFMSRINAWAEAEAE